MKEIIKNFFVVSLMFIAAISITIPLTTSLTYADDNGSNRSSDSISNCTMFLGMKPWNCNLKSWTEEIDEDGNTNIQSNIKKIIMNLAEDGVTIAGYIALGYIIYGGYLYMMSSGDPGKAMSGKKTITRAIIGLLIIGLAKIIFNAIITALGGPEQLAADNDGMELLLGAINWVVSMAGIVCVVFVVVGGYGYMTSVGDPSKLQKAKNTILYAIIGLIIVALSFVITNFVITKLING